MKYLLKICKDNWKYRWDWQVEFSFRGGLRAKKVLTLLCLLGLCCASFGLAYGSRLAFGKFAESSCPSKIEIHSVFQEKSLSTRSITGVNCYNAVCCACGKCDEICLFHAQTIGILGESFYRHGAGTRHRTTRHSHLIQASCGRVAAQNSLFGLRLLHAQLFVSMCFRAVTLRVDRQFLEKCVYPLQRHSIFLLSGSFISRGDNFIFRGGSFIFRGDNFIFRGDNFLGNNKC